MNCETGDEEYGEPDGGLRQTVKNGLKRIKAERLEDEDGEWPKGAVGDRGHQVEEDGEPVLGIAQAFLDLFRLPSVSLTTTGYMLIRFAPERRLGQ